MELMTTNKAATTNEVDAYKSSLSFGFLLESLYTDSQIVLTAIEHFMKSKNYNNIVAGYVIDKFLAEETVTNEKLQQTLSTWDETLSQYSLGTEEREQFLLHFNNVQLALKQQLQLPSTFNLRDYKRSKFVLRWLNNFFPAEERCFTPIAKRNYREHYAIYVFDNRPEVQQVLNARDFDIFMHVAMASAPDKNNKSYSAGWSKYADYADAVFANEQRASGVTKKTLTTIEEIKAENNKSKLTGIVRKGLSTNIEQLIYSEYEKFQRTQELKSSETFEIIELGQTVPLPTQIHHYSSANCDALVQVVNRYLTEFKNNDLIEKIDVLKTIQAESATQLINAIQDTAEICANTIILKLKDIFSDKNHDLYFEQLELSIKEITRTQLLIIFNHELDLLPFDPVKIVRADVNRKISVAKHNIAISYTLRELICLIVTYESNKKNYLQNYGTHLNTSENSPVALRKNENIKQFKQILLQSLRDVNAKEKLQAKQLAFESHKGLIENLLTNINLKLQELETLIQSHPDYDKGNPLSNDLAKLYQVFHNYLIKYDRTMTTCRDFIRKPENELIEILSQEDKEESPEEVITTEEQPEETYYEMGVSLIKSWIGKSGI